MVIYLDCYRVWTRKCSVSLWNDSSRIDIKPNLFLSSFRLSNNGCLAKYYFSARGLSLQQSQYFTDQYNKIRKSTHFLTTTFQNILQTISLFLHPFNSWGFPFEISSPFGGSEVSLFDAIKLHISSIIGKLTVFLYRLSVLFLGLVYASIFSSLQI